MSVTLKTVFMTDIDTKYESIKWSLRCVGFSYIYIYIYILLLPNIDMRMRVQYTYPFCYLDSFQGKV